MMDNTTPPALEEMKDVEKENETVEGELENGEHDDDNDDGFHGPLNDIDQHPPSVFGTVKPQTKLLSSPDSPSNSLELQGHKRGPEERPRHLEDTEPASDMHVTQGLLVDIQRCDSGVWERGEERGKVHVEEEEWSESERVKDSRINRRSAKERWRLRKRERLGGSIPAAKTEGWEKMEKRERWSESRRIGKMEEEEGMQDGGVLNERSEERKSAEEIGDKETERIGDREIDREGTGDSEMEVGSAGDRKMEGERAGDSKMEGESVRDREKEGASSLSSEGSWSPSPHPIFSRMHMHSSVSSSSSSFNCSSAESDDVFSEGEDTASKRSTMRRVRLRTEREKRESVELLDTPYFRRSYFK
jgi:hypothetical protein